MIGLALSGGGFRAAFFHVGVLARLAETGLLPKVEVISTVSGGSIVGAAYYLRLRRLLNEKTDAEISGDDYVRLVAEVERMLRDAVRKDIRARIFANPGKNLQMLLSPGYSRSDRIGDLYDRHLYKQAWEESRRRRSANREEQIEMRELLVEPGGDATFDLEDEEKGNGKRRAKVPALLINATTLNSGHNWRFEAIRMGEPLPSDPRRATIVRETDTNMRLAPGYFPPRDPESGRTAPAPHVPARQAGFPLGLAVAASACVPGAFYPLAISGMYRNDDGAIRVRLVDGGVQDNQGVQGLLDRRCTRLIVSDASGQLKDKRRPRSWLPLSLARSASIAGDRIRDEQLTYLPSGERKYALMHLRKGLDAPALSPGPDQATPTSEREPEYATTEFGVDPDVQRALSEVRTDLDFFSDTEAHSLELDGYLMSDKELGLRGFDALGEPSLVPTEDHAWDFAALTETISAPDAAYLRKLRAGRQKFFRLLWLRPGLAAALALLVLVVLAAVVRGFCAGANALDASGPLRAVVALVLAFVAVFVWANVTAWTARRYGS
ncbi:MAG TPA: patatin-like phospholipase family protein [Solirubrobacterales bacterium]